MQQESLKYLLVRHLNFDLEEKFMEIIELKYFWCNDKLFGAKSEWRKMYFAIENFINLLEMTGEEGNQYYPKGKYYSLKYTFGEKGQTVFIDKNSAKLLADKLGFNL